MYVNRRARDQFELLFVKLGTSCASCLSVTDEGLDLFEEKIKEKAASEAGAAFFDVRLKHIMPTFILFIRIFFFTKTNKQTNRSVTSLAKVAASPSIGGAAQLAFDLFHFLFRDRILDLQAAFPADSRMVDRKTGVDKGPFWGILTHQLNLIFILSITELHSKERKKDFPLCCNSILTTNRTPISSCLQHVCSRS